MTTYACLLWENGYWDVKIPYKKKAKREDWLCWIFGWFGGGGGWGRIGFMLFSNKIYNLYRCLCYIVVTVNIQSTTFSYISVPFFSFYLFIDYSGRSYELFCTISFNVCMNVYLSTDLNYNIFMLISEHNKWWQ